MNFASEVKEFRWATKGFTMNEWRRGKGLKDYGEAR